MKTVKLLLNLRVLSSFKRVSQVSSLYIASSVKTNIFQTVETLLLSFSFRKFLKRPTCQQRSHRWPQV
uniref:Uncharacterized protein n=1 Tax=Brassica campestris TaxID=3711 RepID=A0A3P6DNH3_BRACM|nr:unnamed protein product [Brassica rapa]